MTKINNEYLKKYLEFEAEVKQASQQLKDMKKVIEDELAEKGNVIKTRDYIAAFEMITRSVFNVPENIKDKYKTVREYDRLIVIRRKPDTDAMNNKK
jgi:hypothetical protein